MKIIIGSILLFCLNINTIAQNSIIGKWKLVKLQTKEFGLLETTNNFEKITYKLYEDKSLEKKDSALTAEDSTFIVNTAEEIHYILKTTKIEIRTNKTFKGQMGDKITNGTYIYNKVKKTLTTKSKDEVIKTSNITFENGMLVMSALDIDAVSYFIKEK